MKSLRTPELPFKLQPRGLQSEGLALQYRLESPLPWPWLPGWPRPPRPWTSATARESGRLWFPPGPPGSPTAQWHHQVRSVSKSKERTSIRIQAMWPKILLYFTYARETLFLFSFWIYSMWSETIWEENRSSYHSLPGIEVNPRKDSETKVGISFKRWLLSRCTQPFLKNIHCSSRFEQIPHIFLSLTLSRQQWLLSWFCHLQLWILGLTLNLSDSQSSHLWKVFFQDYHEVWTEYA